MGRTNHHSVATVEDLKEWKEFRNRLGKSDKKLFDRMYATIHLFNSACIYAAQSNKTQPIFISIFLDHYRILNDFKLDSKLIVYTIRASTNLLLSIVIVIYTVDRFFLRKSTISVDNPPTPSISLSSLNRQRWKLEASDDGPSKTDS